VGCSGAGEAIGDNTSALTDGLTDCFAPTVRVGKTDTCGVDWGFVLMQTAVFIPDSFSSPGQK